MNFPLVKHRTCPIWLQTLTKVNGLSIRCVGWLDFLSLNSKCYGYALFSRINSNWVLVNLIFYGSFCSARHMFVEMLIREVLCERANKHTCTNRSQLKLMWGVLIMLKFGLGSRYLYLLHVLWSARHMFVKTFLRRCFMLTLEISTSAQPIVRGR